VLNNCILTGNSALQYGGGANGGALNNCTLVANVVDGYLGDGGGAYYSVLKNCIIYSNSVYSPSSATGLNYSGGTLNYCCTRPIPVSGTGNFTNDPVFLAQGSQNLRLQSSSPCINAGRNMYVAATNDLDGNPRIKGGTVDIGAYEFQNPTSIISYAWLQQYGLPTDGSVDVLDTDSDGINNWQEWIAGTNPTNVASVLKLLLPAQTNTSPCRTLTWQSVSGKMYYLQRATNLFLQPAFSSIQSNITGLLGTTSFTDTNAGPCFYRVGFSNKSGTKAKNPPVQQ